MTATDPTYVGTVTSVTGASVTVELTESLSSGLALIGGQVYSVAQVGSFVRIPLGYQDLYGIVTEVGAQLASGALRAHSPSRWMRVELAGESIGETFVRGISHHPNIGDAVHIVVERDLRRIYGGVGDDQIPIGSLSSSENIPVRVSLNSLVTRHSAVLGSTGAGKSTTVSSLIRSIVERDDRSSPGARILLLDVHGEYSAAFRDMAEVLSISPKDGEKPLFVPYWALEASELLAFLTGPMNESQMVVFSDKILELKQSSLQQRRFPGIDTATLTVDSPIPFSLKRLWYDLIDEETATFSGKNRDVRQLLEEGRAETLTPPRYEPYAMGSAGPFQNPQLKGIRRQLNLLRSRLLDRRYDFILSPGDWTPSLNGDVTNDLDVLLQAWLGHTRPITILDLSNVPSAVLVRLVGSILRIVYEALYWSREKTEGGILRPLLIVMEEAHRYLTAEGGDSAAADIAKRIAKEGRKYGVGAMLVSQRPTEIEETVLAQCGTIFAMRLSNPADRARVRGAMPDNLVGLTELLPVLRTGETIVVGEAARLPVRCRVTLPADEHLPRSRDPNVTEAWSTRRLAEGYDRVVASWRAQSTTAVATPFPTKRNPISPEKG